MKTIRIKRFKKPATNTYIGYFEGKIMAGSFTYNDIAEGTAARVNFIKNMHRELGGITRSKTIIGDPKTALPEAIEFFEELVASAPHQAKHYNFTVDSLLKDYIKQTGLMDELDTGTLARII